MGARVSETYLTYAARLTKSPARVPTPRRTADRDPPTGTTASGRAAGDLQRCSAVSRSIESSRHQAQCLEASKQLHLLTDAPANSVIKPVTEVATPPEISDAMTSFKNITKATPGASDRRSSWRAMAWSRGTARRYGAFAPSGTVTGRCWHLRDHFHTVHHLVLAFVGRTMRTTSG